jgi:hypothetical protein
VRNIWKGLVVGAVTGAAVGLALDVLFGAREQMVDATRAARRRAPEAVEWAAGVTAQARRRLRQADLPDQVRSLAQQIADSDVARQVGGTASGVAATGQRAVRTALESARDARR